MRHGQNGIGRAVRHGMGGAAVALALSLALAGSVRADDTPPPAAAAPPPAAPDDAVVAERGDVKLTVRQVRDMVRFADPDQRHLMETNPTALLQAVRERLLRLVLVHQAEQQGWEKHDDVAWRLAAARDDVMASTWIASQVAADPNFPNDDQIKAAYEANKAKLLLPKQYHVAQIFVLVPAGASKETEDEIRRKLLDLKAQITRQHTDFAVLAKRDSQDAPSAANGGDLGWLREDALVPPIRAAVQGMADGAVSDPVRSQGGWHLLKLLGSKPPTQASLAESRDTLVHALRQERQMEGQRDYLGGLLKQQPIEVNEVELNKLSVK